MIIAPIKTVDISTPWNLFGILTHREPDSTHPLLTDLHPIRQLVTIERNRIPAVSVSAGNHRVMPTGLTMFELIKKSILAGLGAGIITKEKAEEAAQKLVEQGKLTADDAKQLADRLLESGGQQWEELQAGITDTVRKSLSSANAARDADLASLAERLENIEHRITMLENSLRPENHDSAQRNGK